MGEPLLKRPPSHRERIYDSLRHDISNYSIGPGTQLFTADIAQRYGVSHIPVREALASLERDGFAEYNRRHGYFARALNLENLHADVEMVAFALKIGAEKICFSQSKIARTERSEKFIISQDYASFTPEKILDEMGRFYNFIVSCIKNANFERAAFSSIQRTINLRSIAFSQYENFADHVRERREFITAMLTGDIKLANDLVQEAYVRRRDSLPDLLPVLQRKAEVEATGDG